ncbi:MAG: hemerythrin domain-containing protein [Tepidimonas ignava]|nr:hemerythrin domain-containing protein [Tepidimonas ignava]
MWIVQAQRSGQHQANHEQPFEWLRACHDRVEHTLDLLLRLLEHVDAQGADEQAVQAAAQVMRYFDLAAPLHHQDEELHVFPQLQASGDPVVQAWVQRLQADHEAMTADWAWLRQALLRLQQAAGDPHWRWSDEERRVMHAFAQRYEDHIALEEGRVFPRAEGCMSADERAAMSADMLRRRAVGGAGQ